MWPFPTTAPKPAYEHYLKLTNKELMDMKVGMDPISTVTWVDSIDEKLLRERVEQMVSINPWLAGRFVKHNDGTIEMGYNNSNKSTADEMMQVVDDDPELGRYNGGASYSKLMTLVEPHLLKAGRDLKQQQMWKLTIVKPSVLIVSMTHSLGDGSSYYTLFQMLISGNIEKVQIERVFGLPERMETVLGGYEEAHLNDNWGLIMCFARGMIQSLLIAPLLPFAQKATARFFLVKSNVIEEMKEKVATNNDDTVPYISTNDIITSWFFKTANLGHSLMAMNLRGRMDDLQHQNMVGNYEELFYYRTPDIGTPELIRKSLQQMKRAVTGDQRICARSLAFSTLAIISNWSTFSNLGGAVDLKVVGHAPVSEIEKSVPSTTTVCIVFEARPGQLGIMVMGTPSKLKSLQAAAPFEDTDGEPFLGV